MLRQFFLIATIFLAGNALAAPAVVVADLYVAEVEVETQSESERRGALRTALSRVLVRVSGDTAVAGRGGAEVLLSEAGRFLNRYQYVEERGPEGETRTLLRAHFDAGGLERQLKSYGLPVWPSRRAQTLVWMALMDESGERLLLDEAAARERFPEMFDTANGRGLPLAFPLLDLEDQSAVQFADVWAGFMEPVRAASERYDVQHIALLRVERVDGNWSSTLTALAPNRDPRYWAYTATTPGQALAVSLTAYADTLAERYAVQSDGAWARDTRLRVSGVRDLRSYGELLKHLESLGPVTAVQVAELAADSVAFQLRFDGDIERLEQAIALGRLIEVEPEVPLEDQPAPEQPLFFAVRERPELRYRMRARP